MRAEPGPGGGQRVRVDGTSPALRAAFVRDTFTAMVAGVRGAAVASGGITATTFDRGLSALHRTAEADGTFHYTFIRATAEA